MPNLNLSKIEWENVTVEIQGKKYNLFPMTFNMNKKYMEVLEKAKDDNDMAHSVELIEIISDIPKETIQTLSVYEMNEITIFYYDHLHTREKKKKTSKK